MPKEQSAGAVIFRIENKKPHYLLLHYPTGKRIQYYFRVEGKTIFKTVVFFLAFTKKKEVKISFEHKGFVWLPFEPAMKKLKFANARKILQLAHKFLKKQKSG